MSLLDVTEMTANHVPGSTALGHHWDLNALDGNQIGDTKREYEGGGLTRGLRRAMTATGLGTDGPIHAVVRDAAEQPVVRLFSTRDRGEDRRVEVTEPGGAPIGVAHRVPGEGFTFKDPSGGVIATIPIAKDQQGPWELLDGTGTRIGIAGNQPATAARINLGLVDDLLGLHNPHANANAEFQATMHLGFAFSATYSVTLAAPAPHPLIALTPVLLAYAY